MLGEVARSENGLVIILRRLQVPIQDIQEGETDENILATVKVFDSLKRVCPSLWLPH